MNIQIYCGKKNFDAQKAERYFKERRIPFQALDLKKHKLGEREIRMMISAIGIEKLIDRDDKKVKEHPACYYDREDLLIPAIQENPWLIRVPIVRNGNKMTIGYQPDIWAQWE
ncbi:arsenate reductase family protein [Aristaeella hokkaidonensis]|uniref:ArsC family transcriptional regulator n=1 Tax=Aristaeella hokkaidonensis TaxID=3046382 RepID=A0AC61MYJ5_9FIRM|nr:ArsC/Spx/MgsR family protein [Aristaeella hokkaidonensis]QTE71124.1 ArsC family transcriptional regulator [Clostridiales bacterium FE2011]QTE75087.1 ArsC family transcriptional regulator [Clostridiales bacterium FE2010]QUC68122.1 ArsC family transcriptional regulator [Aristaeella hokkaidonensis]SNT93196.1 ArsC family protein [Aristaeella hokkaidonensis]